MNQAMTPTTAPISKRSHAAARGFTLLETVLAMVLGAMVLAGTLGVFLGLRNMESTFSARYERTSELDITHTIITRAMLSLLMEEPLANAVTRTTNGAEPAQSTEPEPRFRMILEADPGVSPDLTGWRPQRFEIVNATPPAPSGLATQSASWFVAQDQPDSVDFSAMDGSQGTVRGVFEMRPAGSRERVMYQLGLIKDGDPALRDMKKPSLNSNSGPNSGSGSGSALTQNAPKPDWTLWWRPILTFESDQLSAGAQPFSDTQGTPEEIRARLAGAIPLMRHIERCTWELFKADQFVSTFAGLTMSDLPAYAQFEVILTNSQYASWMFEVDWVLGDDPSVVASTGAPGEETDDDANAGPNTGNVNGGNRPGQPDPGGDRTINFSGDS
jgi:Tfp pilus assembly protein PilV